MIQRPPLGVWAVLAGSALLIAGFAFTGPREQLALAAFVGRFHPALVHLPIGALFAAGVLVVLARRGQQSAARAAVTPVLVVAAAGAFVAVIAGQALASDGDYAGPTFEWHRRLGYAVAVLTSVAAVASWWAARTVSGVRSAIAHPEGLPPKVSKRRPDPRVFADVIVVAGVLLLGLTGHLGGTLTHGEGYLTERLPAPFSGWLGRSAAVASTRRVQPSEVVVYESLIAPILQDHCVDCHGPSKASGELRLDTPEHITAGGRTGPVIVAGQAAASELVHRLWLPPSHKDVMPPKSRPAIPVADASVLRWWVETGASFEHSLADVEMVAEVSPAIRARVGALSMDGPPLLSLDPGPLDTAALTRLTGQSLPVSRLAEDVDWLQVEARGAGRAFDDGRLEALLPVAAHVTWMDLGGTAVTDKGVALLAKFPHLTRLHLDRTAVTDTGAEALAGLAHLESLNIYATAMTDAGLQRLANSTSLRAVYVANTAITPEGVQAAAAARPDMVLHAGLTETAPVAEPPGVVRATRPTPSR